jgi:purine-binding chemotaxis protein CheW
MSPELQVAEEPAQVQLCAFMVGAEEYAIDIHRVLEILHLPAPAQFPRAPGYDGMLNLRGEILPLVDLRRVFGTTTPADSRRQGLLVCMVGRRKIVFRVDKVTQVVRARRDELKPVPPLGGEALKSPHVIGICPRGSRLLLLLNLRAVLGA